MSGEALSLTKCVPRDAFWIIAQRLTPIQLQVFKWVDTLCNAVVKQLLEEKIGGKLQEAKIFLKNSISQLGEGTEERAELQGILDKIETSAACKELFQQDTSFKAASLLGLPFTNLCILSPNVFDEIVDKTPASSFKKELLSFLKLRWVQDMNSVQFPDFEGAFVSQILIPPERLYGNLPKSFFRIPEKYMEIGFYESAQFSVKNFELLTHQTSIVLKLDWYENFIRQLCEAGRADEAIAIVRSILQINPESSVSGFLASQLALAATVYDVLYDSGHVQEAFEFLNSVKGRLYFPETYSAGLYDFRLARANARIKESSAKLSEACQSFLSVSKKESSIALKMCIEVLIQYGFKEEAIPALREMNDLVLKYLAFEDFGFEEELPTIFDSMNDKEKERLDQILKNRESSASNTQGATLQDQVQEFLLSGKVKKALEAKKSGDEGKFDALYSELEGDDQLTVDALLQEIEYNASKDLPKIEERPNLEQIKLARAEFARCIEEELIKEALESAKEMPDDLYKFYALLGSKVPELKAEALALGRRMVQELGLRF